MVSIKKLGNISFYDSAGAGESAFQKPYSEATARLIDEEVRDLVSRAYSRASAILTEHRVQLDALAGLLLQKEVVFKEDLERVLGVRTSVCKRSA